MPNNIAERMLKTRRINGARNLSDAASSVLIKRINHAARFINGRREIILSSGGTRVRVDRIEEGRERTNNAVIMPTIPLRN